MSGPPEPEREPAAAPERAPRPAAGQPAAGTAAARGYSPPPLEANDQMVAAVGAAVWAVALVVLLLVRSDVKTNDRWWIWTAAAGLGLGLFALWYLPRLKRSRQRAALRRAGGQDQAGA